MMLEKATFYKLLALKTAAASCCLYKTFQYSIVPHTLSGYTYTIRFTLRSNYKRIIKNNF